MPASRPPKPKNRSVTVETIDLPTRSFRAENLAAERGDRRLFQQVSFRLDPGQLLQVTGRNGSGKTTLLRILSGLSRPMEGEFYWGDEPIRSVDGGTGSCLAYLGHANAQKDDLTAAENLILSGRLGGRPVDDITAATVLAQLGLAGFEDVPIRFLSQGQKRRVAIARLLLQQRPLWILDEPYAALDVQVIEVLRGAIETHLQHNGMIIITTHQAVDIAGDCHSLHLG